MWIHDGDMNELEKTDIIQVKTNWVTKNERQRMHRGANAVVFYGYDSEELGGGQKKLAQM